ncbi:hypothetical protein TVAG_329000 [Trichomonas vaginalis G3]|uniref:Uncharacterized protein n=1 Tax=Trichomonas vaginalis (strain ATCC PRA-98 / G3) TaxID=412133 RepID=A2EW41_TRIV3|nr:hypothetical protein TVAGG3_0687030 [Trichomonas vaginalis G3]EAY03127.1 hypothetical protein TVAG_329000 [Trichomonas vaginalis G3]KAI5508296.1 hypothetical protein TVAGG3_0687030 [Trichomonas vaginalis G3]|eukprot:XP_001315350.1 hypothetical protein [Trichomonas vaginalis G3]
MFVLATLTISAAKTQDQWFKHYNEHFVVPYFKKLDKKNATALKYLAQPEYFHSVILPRMQREIYKGIMNQTFHFKPKYNYTMSRRVKNSLSKETMRFLKLTHPQGLINPAIPYMMKYINNAVNGYSEFDTSLEKNALPKQITDPFVRLGEMIKREAAKYSVVNSTVEKVKKFLREAPKDQTIVLTKQKVQDLLAKARQTAVALIKEAESKQNAEEEEDPENAWITDLAKKYAQELGVTAAVEKAKHTIGAFYDKYIKRQPKVESNILWKYFPPKEIERHVKEILGTMRTYQQADKNFYNPSIVDQWWRPAPKANKKYVRPEFRPYFEWI